ncbi:hypothetical protein Dimus_026876 [Dionaea muscipula]
MTTMFKRVQGLYVATANKAREDILGGVDTTDKEATPDQQMGLVPLQAVRIEGVGTSQSQEQIGAISPAGMTLRSASPPPERKKPSPPPLTVEESVGDEASAESTTLVKRKRAPASQTLVAAGGDEEIIDLTLGREKEDAADGAITQVTEQAGELELLDLSLLGDDATLRKYLIVLNEIKVSDEEATDMANDVASPPKKKQRKLVKKGIVAAVGSEEIVGG